MPPSVLEERAKPISDCERPVCLKNKAAKDKKALQEHQKVNWTELNFFFSDISFIIMPFLCLLPGRLVYSPGTVILVVLHGIKRIIQHIPRQKVIRAFFIIYFF
jgi:hypothetical protein